MEFKSWEKNNKEKKTKKERNSSAKVHGTNTSLEMEINILL